MGKFSGASEARVSQGGVYFLAGKYKVRLKKVTLITSRKKKDLYTIECKILESSNDKRAVGTSATQQISMDQDAALGNIKGFLAAAMGLDPEANDKDLEEQGFSDWESLMEESVDDDNPLADTELYLECVDIKTRAGGDFTLHKWSAEEA